MSQIICSAVSKCDQTAVGLLTILVSESECGDDQARSIEHGDSVSHTGGAIMNADQFKGKWMQFKGELKKQYGKFTDDDL